MNTVAFAVRARDGDNDTMIYSIDETSVGFNTRCQHKENKYLIVVNNLGFSVFTGQPDADYFRIDLPNSGEVILAKPLDYETKTVLTVTIHASVSNCKKKKKKSFQGFQNCKLKDPIVTITRK